MRRAFLAVVLTAGAIAGFASGAWHMAHSDWRHGDACAWHEAK